MYFACQVIVGSLVIRGSRSDYAEKAVIELSRGVELCEESGCFGRRGRSALVSTSCAISSAILNLVLFCFFQIVLQKLRERAFETYRKTHDGKLPPGISEPKTPYEGDNEKVDDHIAGKATSPEWLDLIPSTSNIQPSTVPAPLSSYVPDVPSYLQSTSSTQLQQVPYVRPAQPYTDEFPSSISGTSHGEYSSSNLGHPTGWQSTSPNTPASSGVTIETMGRSAIAVYQDTQYDTSMTVGAEAPKVDFDALFNDNILRGIDPKQQEAADYFATFGMDGSLESGNLGWNANAVLGSDETWMSFAVDSGLLDQSSVY